LTNSARYDAESTIRKDGRIVFTSLRGGDLDIYTMDENGRDVRQLTHELGYDGGPFWSYDGRRLSTAPYHPQTDAEKRDYQALLNDNLIRPTTLDLWVMDMRDGKNKRQVTRNGKAKFCALLLPGWTANYLRLKYGRPERGATSISMFVRVDGSGSSELLIMKPSTEFPMCSRPTGRSSSLPQIAPTPNLATQIYSLPEWVE
jgi:Tol biopolymer transport system component